MQDEDCVAINADLTLNMTVFKYFINVISTPAIRLVEKEWLKLQDLLLESNEDKLRKCKY